MKEAIKWRILLFWIILLIIPAVVAGSIFIEIQSRQSDEELAAYKNKIAGLRELTTEHPRQLPPSQRDMEMQAEQEADALARELFEGIKWQQYFEFERERESLKYDLKARARLALAEVNPPDAKDSRYASETKVNDLKRRMEANENIVATRRGGKLMIYEAELKAAYARVLSAPKSEEAKDIMNELTESKKPVTDIRDSIDILKILTQKNYPEVIGSAQ